MRDLRFPASLLLLLLLLLPLLQAVGCATPAASRNDPPAAGPTIPRAEYRVELLDPAERAVAVEMRLSGLDPAQARVPLSLPEGYSFLRLEEPLLAVPVAARTASGAEIAVERQGPYRWSVAKGSATEVLVTWTGALTAHDRPDVAARDSFGHPYVAADHALLMTGALLVAPDLEPEPQWRVRLAGPAGWPVLCAWDEVEPGLRAPRSRQALQNDLIALGAWSTRRVEVSGMRIDLGFAPGQPALETLAAPAVEAICAAELELFGTTPRASYLFLFVAPKAVQGFSFAGSPKDGAMVLQVCGDLANPVAKEMIAHLVAHEFHHLWAVSRLDFGDALRFVGEGFTDWYAHVVPARLGIVPWKEFGEKLGEAIDVWNALAPRWSGALTEAGGPRFFEGGDAYDATYRGGLLVAAVLDLELRRAGRADGLDGWLRELVNDARWSPRASGPGVDDFLAHVEGALGSAGRERVARWITQANGFDPLAELARLGVAFEQRREPRTLRANFEGLRVTALDPQCEAARLGLRTGDRVEAVNGQPVTDERGVQSAWARPIDGRSSLRVERDGQELELCAPAADPRVRTAVEPRPWQGTEGPARPSHGGIGRGLRRAG
jgi:predicted metalloprotease with PDZ domain